MGGFLISLAFTLAVAWVGIHVSLPGGSEWLNSHPWIMPLIAIGAVACGIFGVFFIASDNFRKESKTSSQKAKQAGNGNQAVQVSGNVGGSITVTAPPQPIAQDQTPQVRIGFFAATGELTVENRSTSVDACRVRLQSFSRGGISVESETLDLLAHRSGQLFRTETTYINQHGMRASAYGISPLLTRTIDPVELRLEFSNAFGQQFYRTVTFPANSSVMVAMQRSPDFEHGSIERVT
jgi:hypothetical protein